MYFVCILLRFSVSLPSSGRSLTFWVPYCSTTQGTQKKTGVLWVYPTTFSVVGSLWCLCLFFSGSFPTEGIGFRVLSTSGRSVLSTSIIDEMRLVCLF